MAKYILAGGSGTGKSAVADELQQRGYNTIAEGARQIIDEENLRANQDPTYFPILPGTDICKFQQKVISRQFELESRVQEGNNFLDRSLIDPIAYSNAGGGTYPDELPTLIQQAGYTKVFFFDRLPFYINDPGRVESQEESERVHAELLAVHQDLGFIIEHVPYIDAPTKEESIARRADYVLQRL